MADDLVEVAVAVDNVLAEDLQHTGVVAVVAYGNQMRD